jgi:hypothetical protein
MEFDDRSVPLTRRQLDIWVAPETGRSGAEWQLGVFGRIESAVEPHLLDQAIGNVQVSLRSIDFSDVDLEFYDLSGSRDPKRFALFRTTANLSHGEFLRTTYTSDRDTRRRQLVNLLPDIADECTPVSPNNEAVRLIETGVFGISMLRPLISRGLLTDRVRCVYSRGHLTLREPIGIDVVVTSNTRHSHRAANGRSRFSSIRRSQPGNRIQTPLRNHRVRSGVSGHG